MREERHEGRSSTGRQGPGTAVPLVPRLVGETGLDLSLDFHFEPYTWVKRGAVFAPRRLGEILAPEGSAFPIAVGDRVEVTWKIHPLFPQRRLALRLVVEPR